ncbi:MAG: SRPBCC domain-containing protein [Pseudobacter sp.]|uniref:SRPBCC domain-containing protein n=1 Tax=Pseudobacter sp. TaxID=2045420 RepID=UPI003F813245
MTNSYTVEREIIIDAPAATIWQVLTDTSFIKQWDDVPEGFGEATLSPGSKLQWDLGDGHQSSVTVTAFEPQEYLKTSLYVTRWPSPPSAYDIGYHYRIIQRQGVTLLKITVGDFGALGENAANYVEASEVFVKDGGDKIKTLAENFNS